MRNKRGNLIVEMVLVLPLFIVFLGALLFVIRYFSFHQSLLSSASYVAHLASSRQLSEAVLQNEMNRVIKNRYPYSFFVVTGVQQPFKKTPASRFYSLREGLMQGQWHSPLGVLELKQSVVIEEAPLS